MGLFHGSLTRRSLPRFWAQLGLAGDPQDPNIIAARDQVLNHLHAVHNQVHDNNIRAGNDPAFLLASSITRNELKRGFIDPNAQLPAPVRNLDEEAAAEALYDLFRLSRLVDPADWEISSSKSPKGAKMPMAPPAASPTAPRARTSRSAARPTETHSEIPPPSPVIPPVTLELLLAPIPRTGLTSIGAPPESDPVERSSLVAVVSSPAIKRERQEEEYDGPVKKKRGIIGLDNPTYPDLEDPADLQYQETEAILGLKVRNNENEVEDEDMEDQFKLGSRDENLI